MNWILNMIVSANLRRVSLGISANVVVGEIWGANKGTFKGNVRNYLAKIKLEQFQMEQKKAYQL